jgi:tetratricopeptide (TPR) repeat protein
METTMSSKPATVRQTSWLLTLPQLAVEGLLILFVYVVFRPMSWTSAVIIGLGVYLIYSFAIQELLTKSHRTGIALVRRQLFDEAIHKFEESYQFFSAHEWIDRYRSLILMTPTTMNYREMALLNIAYCYNQLGKAREARNYYERTRKEFPRNELARKALESESDSATVTQ